MTSFGVGFLGAGPVAQAIHLPTIARYPDRFKVVHIMDVDTGLSQALSARTGSRWTTDEDVLISDPTVEIVVVGSPNSHHARQVIKCCEAGKKLVLAEKPLATNQDELRAIMEAAERSGTKIIVGTMHAFDSAYLKALEVWKGLNIKAHSVEVSAHLPTNSEFVDLATTLIEPTKKPSGPSPDAIPVSKTDSDKSTVANGILGLAMHDIPLMREFAHGDLNVSFAAPTEPWGYLIHGNIGETSLRLLAKMPGEWAADWTFRALSQQYTFEIAFKPSYIHAGTCVARVSGPSQTFEFEFAESPYEAEWLEIAAVAEGTKEPTYSLKSIEGDAQLAIQMVEQSVARMVS